MRKNKVSFAISPGAADDISNIAVWYHQKVEGLGNRFLLRLKASFKKVQLSPEAYARINPKSNIRRCVVPGFPYKTYFLFLDGHVEVLAVIHMSRSNRYIKRKLK